MSTSPMNINTTLATSINDYYHNIPLTLSHQQHLHHSLPHNIHSQQISSSSNLPSMISLNNPVRITNIPVSSIYNNSHQTQLMNNSQTIYNSNIEMIPANYNINQQNQQQILIHSSPVASASNGAIHYMLESTLAHSNKYTSVKNMNLNNTPTASSSSTQSGSIALINSTSNDLRQAELNEILVQDPRLSSVDHSILLHHRSNNFSNENPQYLMLNSHHLQPQQHIDQQILINNEHDFAVISSSTSQMSPVVTSVNSTINNTIDNGYHHNSLSSHHHSLGTIVYMEEEEELLDTENLSNSHQHHLRNHIISEQNDMDDLIGGEENLLNNEDDRQNSSNGTLKFMHENSIVPIVDNNEEQHDMPINDNKFLHRNPMIEMQTSSFKNVHNNEISINKNEENDLMQHQIQSVVKDRNDKASNDNNHFLQQHSNNDLLDKEIKL